MHLWAHIVTSGIGLSDRQFSFPKGYFIDDAVRTLTERLKSARGAWRWAVAMGLNIRNAFNSIGWKEIRAALKRMDFSWYLKRTIQLYLGDRSLI